MTTYVCYTPYYDEIHMLINVMNKLKRGHCCLYIVMSVLFFFVYRIEWLNRNKIAHIGHNNKCSRKKTYLHTLSYITQVYYTFSCAQQTSHVHSGCVINYPRNALGVNSQSLRFTGHIGNDCARHVH